MNQRQAPVDVESQLRLDEGSKNSVYPDSLGYWTISVGVCIDARKGCSLTDAECELLFQNRLTLVKTKLEKEFPWTSGLDLARLGVLRNMAYQMGIHGVSEFKEMLAALQRGDYVVASSHMLDSKWAKQSPARAQRLATQMSTGIWQ